MDESDLMDESWIHGCQNSVSVNAAANSHAFHSIVSCASGAASSFPVATSSVSPASHTLADSALPSCPPIAGAVSTRTDVDVDELPPAPPIDLSMFLEECIRCQKPLSANLYLSKCGHVYHEQCCMDWRGCVVCDDIVYESSSALGNDANSAAASSAASTSVLKDNLGNRRRKTQPRKTKDTATLFEKALKSKSLVKLFFEPLAVLNGLCSAATSSSATEEMSLSQEQAHFESLSLEARSSLLESRRSKLLSVQRERDKLDQEFLQYQTLVSEQTGRYQHYVAEHEKQAERSKRYRKILKTQQSDLYRVDRKLEEITQEMRKLMKELNNLDRGDVQGTNIAMKGSIKLGSVRSASPFATAEKSLAQLLSRSTSSSVIPTAAPAADTSTTASASIPPPPQTPMLSQSHRYLQLTGNDFWRDLLHLDPNLLFECHELVLAKSQGSEGNNPPQPPPQLHFTSAIDSKEIGVLDMPSLSRHSTLSELKKLARTEPKLITLAAANSSKLNSSSSTASAANLALLHDQASKANPNNIASSSSIPTSVISASMLLDAVCNTEEPSESLIVLARQNCTSLQIALHRLLMEMSSDPAVHRARAKDIASKLSVHASTFRINAERNAALEQKEISFQKLINRFKEKQEQERKSDKSSQKPKPRAAKNILNEALQDLPAEPQTKKAKTAPIEPIFVSPDAPSVHSSVVQLPGGTHSPHDAMDLTDGFDDDQPGLHSRLSMQHDEEDANQTENARSTPAASTSGSIIPPPPIPSATAYRPTSLGSAFASRSSYLQKVPASLAKSRLASAMSNIDRVAQALEQNKPGSLQTIRDLNSLQKAADSIPIAPVRAAPVRENPFGIKTSSSIAASGAITSASTSALPVTASKPAASKALSTSASLLKRGAREDGGEFIVRGPDGRGGTVQLLRPAGSNAHSMAHAQTIAAAAAAKEKEKEKRRAAAATAATAATGLFSIDGLAKLSHESVPVDSPTTNAIDPSAIPLSRSASYSSNSATTSVVNVAPSKRAASPTMNPPTALSIAAKRSEFFKVTLPSRANSSSQSSQSTPTGAMAPSTPQMVLSQQNADRDVVDLIDDDDEEDINDAQQPTHPFFARSNSNTMPNRAQKSADANTIPKASAKQVDSNRLPFAPINANTVRR